MKYLVHTLFMLLLTSLLTWNYEYSYEVIRRWRMWAPRGITSTISCDATPTGHTSNAPAADTNKLPKVQNTPDLLVFRTPYQYTNDQSHKFKFTKWRPFKNFVKFNIKFLNGRHFENCTILLISIPTIKT